MYLFVCLLHQVLVAACGISFPDQGSNLGLLHWEHRVSAGAPPGESYISKMFQPSPVDLAMNSRLEDLI